MYSPTVLEILSAFFLFFAVLHTFFVKRLHHISRSFARESFARGLFELLGEVEVVFGLWAALLLLSMVALSGESAALAYLESLDFSEPAFVFVVMAIAATKPVYGFAAVGIETFARPIKFLNPRSAFLLSALIVGPLLGSFITEPAAMTVTALALRARVFHSGYSQKFRYLVLGCLFVNISVGGAMTPFAAPPILMVAKTWNWDLAYIFSHFGWKAILVVITNAAIVSVLGRSELREPLTRDPETRNASPGWLTAIHLSFLVLVIMLAHHAIAFLGVFLFFLGAVTVTSHHQEDIKLRESLLVGFFLAGLVVLGAQQEWWLGALLSSLNQTALYFGAVCLTAVTDNAALTFLGSRVPNLSEAMRYALTSGAIVGGGLTVIANAPNPAGVSLLQKTFGPDGVSPGLLFRGAVLPTIIAAVAFYFL